MWLKESTQAFFWIYYLSCDMVELLRKALIVAGQE